MIDGMNANPSPKAGAECAMRPADDATQEPDGMGLLKFTTNLTNGL
jgi:hypothetical protein